MIRPQATFWQANDFNAMSVYHSFPWTFITDVHITADIQLIRLTPWMSCTIRHFEARPFWIGGRDSSVGIATRYGLGGSGSECRWKRDFPQPVQTGPWDNPASCTMCAGSFPGVKWPGRGVHHPPHLALRLKEE